MNEIGRKPGTHDERLRDGVPGTMLGYSSEAREWLEGAIDMHVHGYPEISRDFVSRESDVETARLASSYGIAGWVLKSHLWPTMDRVYYMREALAGTGFMLFSSVTLNPLIGGVSPFVVEAAAAHGAQVIFMPTWGSKNDNSRTESYILDLLSTYMPSARRFANQTEASVVSEAGSLTSDAIEVINLCRDLDLVLCTGHLSLEETTRIAEYAGEAGFRKLVLTHMLSSVKSPEDLVPLANTGAFIEFCNAGNFNPRNDRSIRRVHEALEIVGVQSSILSTDVFSPFAPPQPECLRIAVQQLAYLGWSRDQVSTLIRGNPRFLLGLDHDVTGSQTDSQSASTPAAPSDVIL